MKEDLIHKSGPDFGYGKGDERATTSVVSGIKFRCENKIEKKTEKN